jgi:hypothetical protein
VKEQLKKICQNYQAIVWNNVQTIYTKKGFPDVTIIKQGGGVAFVECKKEGVGEKGLSPSQGEWRDVLLAQGATWMLFNYSPESIKKLTDWLNI